MENLRKHDRIQMQIIDVCRNLGVEAKHEHRGKGWRADVFIPNGPKPIAFEIQLSPQSLSRTLERQSKYIRDGIVGCWLFESPVAKLIDERPDLPVFYVEEGQSSNLIVNLGTRRKIDLQTFLEKFISEDIQFRSSAITSSVQQVQLCFYEMVCWNCGVPNHLFSVETPFYSSCNALIKREEAMWQSNSIEYMPEIIEMATRFANSRTDLDLKLSVIKPRFSKTVDKEYMSFGCYKCDSIFGDWHVMEAKLEARFDPDSIPHQGTIELKSPFTLNIPHWCFPANGHFCADY